MDLNELSIDLVAVVDLTQDMEGCLPLIRTYLKAWPRECRSRMAQKLRPVGHMRIRVIGFRDFLYNPGRAIEASPFFTMPEEYGALCGFVDGLKAEGGGDRPENTLEALALAMQSPWIREGRKRRHVIHFFANAEPLPLDDADRRICPDYPPNMPSSIRELKAMWDGRGGALGGMPFVNGRSMVGFIFGGTYQYNDLIDFDNCLLESVPFAGPNIDTVAQRMILDSISVL